MGKPTTQRQVILFVLIVLCLLFVVGYASRLTERTRLLAEIAQQEVRIAQAQQKHERLQADLAYVQSDAYVEQMAREQLGLVLPGDKLVIRVAPPPGSTPAAQSTPVAAPNAPVAPAPIPPWREWLDLFWPVGSSQ